MKTNEDIKQRRAESYEKNRLQQLKEKVLEEAEKEHAAIPVSDNKQLKAVRKVDRYKKAKKSDKGVRNSLAVWQNDNFEMFMHTWNEIDDPALKARLYLDSLNYTIGKVGSVDLNLQVKQNSLEEQIGQLIDGNINIEIEEQEAEIIQDEEEEKEN